MIDLTSFFIAKAFAADAPQAADVATQSVNAFMQFVPFFLILAVFYFLLIRPQQKKLVEQENMIKALQKGDKVITNGGIVGSISKIESDDYIQVEIANNVHVRFTRSSVSSLVPAEKTAPKNDNKKD